MPKVEVGVPGKLRPFLFHGVDLSWDSRKAVGDCPWCGREGKFCVYDLAEGLWRCYVCGEASKDKVSGNLYTFLGKLWEVSDKSTLDYSSLATDRQLLPDTLVHWELAQSSLTGDWLIPGRSVKGKLCQLYKYTRVQGKFRLLATPGLGHQLHGVSLFHPANLTVYVCEGPWDAMALWEALGQCKQVEGGRAATANVERSLLSGANVLAVPGCATFSEDWLPLFRDRVVVLMYDNDHPRRHPKTGKRVDPAGWVGMGRAARMLAGVASEVQILRWSPDDDHDAALPSGFDVRDALTATEGSLPDRLGKLLSLVGPAPEGWLKPTKASGKHSRSSGEAMKCLPCKTYRTLVTAWRKALLWTDGLDRALSCMLASVASTQMLGDQLWLKVVGPAACGKSTLCEALSVNHEYILAKSTIRGFHSGFKERGGGKDEDNSLLSILPGKTLITKDGDTLLQSPNLPQILSEGRDVYDGVSRTHYRNAMSKDYDGLRITWILCGTSSLRQIDSSELGERFLDCVIMDSINDELEDEILERVVHRAARDVSVESNGEAVKQHSPEMANVMQLTGGYVAWLRENAADRLPQIGYSPQVRRKITRLGKFVAHMRARPSLKQEEIAEREFATRLVSQLTRLAGCLALVLNRTSVDEEVMRRVHQVAMDTSRGRTLSIASHLRDAPEEGMESKTLTMLAGQTEEKTRALLRFLRAIGVVETHQSVNEKGVKGRLHWRLTRRMTRLYHEVMGGIE
jgi:hypothetical protein